MTRTSLSTRLTAKERDERYLSFVDSFSEPFPINCFKALRLGSDLTLQELADTVGLSKQTLIRTEQGLFDDPPYKLMQYWLMQGENELDLSDRYHDFQLTVRSRHHRLFGDSLGKPTRYTTAVHPLEWLLTQWITGQPLNVMEMAKLLCISQPLLNNWLNNPKQASVPKPLITALLQNGYSKREISTFIKAYDLYRIKLGLS